MVSRQKLVVGDISLSHAAWKTYPSTTVEAEDGSISSSQIIATSYDLDPQKDPKGSFLEGKSPTSEKKWPDLTWNLRLSPTTRHLFVADDDPVLHYQFEEGSRIEPKW